MKRAESVSPRTVNLYRAILHRMFKLCVSPWLLMASNPVSGTEKLREEPREPVLITDNDYRDLLDKCTKHTMLNLFVQLAWETGGRSGEILQLEWRDINFDQKLLTFANDTKRGRTTKGRRSRTIPISSNAVEALREHAATFRFSDPQSLYLFKHLRSDREARPGDRIQSLYRAFKKAAKAAGFTELRPHDLRHCFVTRKLAEGIAAQLVFP